MSLGQGPSTPFTYTNDLGCCNFCGCNINLHSDEGCICEDSEGHAKTLGSTDGEEYCKCLRAPKDFAPSQREPKLPTPDV